MHTRRLHMFSGALVALLIGVGAHLVAQQKSAVPAFTDGDWPRFAGDFAGTKYSKLTQINTTNVSQLVQAWTFAGIGAQQTPIVVNGILYASASSGVVALDGATGEVVWRYGAAPAAGGGGGGRGAGGGRGRGAGGPGGGGPGAGAPAAGAPAAGAEAVLRPRRRRIPPLVKDRTRLLRRQPVAARAAVQAVQRGAGRGAAAGGRGAAVPTAEGPGSAPSSRGVAYWPGDGTLPPRILMMVGERLVALNATNGTLDTAFGTGGFVDIGVNWGGVPLVFKNIVVVGSNNGEVTLGHDPWRHQGLRCAHGREALDFVSVAQPGDPNHAAAWLNEGWKNRQGVNHWGWYFTLDEQREILYTTFGSPAGNYWGGDRPGSNLYANSVVAVDVNTGKYLWHFQTVHHDLWDSDQPSPPTLVDMHAEWPPRSGAGPDRQDRLDVPARSDQRQAAVRCGGASRAEGRCARRVVFAHAAVSRKAAAARARRLQEGRSRDRVRHDAGTREELPGVVREGGRVLQRRPVHAVPLPRRRRAAEEHDPVSGQRRHQLGRSGRRSVARLHLRVHAGRRVHRLDREEAARAATTGAATDRRSRTTEAASPDRAPTPGSPRRWDRGCRRVPASDHRGDASRP